jgi:hypothetical protein
LESIAKDHQLGHYRNSKNMLKHVKEDHLEEVEVEEQILEVLKPAFFN